MAEKGSVPQTDAKTVEQITTILAGLLLLGAIATALLNLLDSFGIGSFSEIWAVISRYFLEHIWPVWKFLAVVVSGLAVLGIIYNSRKLNAINVEEQIIFNPLITTDSSAEEEIVDEKNERWERIVKYSNSGNPAEWKQAILEADVMLEELLRSLGYMGESVGEMLKSVEKSDFLTIEDAWEAHKIRNAVAHSGGDYQLNERETKRVISLFEKVFNEFDLI